MPCTPKKTVCEIIESGNHYCIGLKANQRKLLERAQQLHAAGANLMLHYRASAGEALAVAASALLLAGSVALLTLSFMVGGPGARLDVPVTHINASYVRSHFDANASALSSSPPAAPG